MDEQNEQDPRETLTERYDRAAERINARTPRQVAMAMEAPRGRVPDDRAERLRERAKYHREESKRCEALAIDPDSADLDTRFTYHPPQPGQPHRHESIRNYARGFAEEIIATCPPSRERSLALTDLGRACFWANAAIARRDPK